MNSFIQYPVRGIPHSDVIVESDYKKSPPSVPPLKGIRIRATNKYPAPKLFSYSSPDKILFVCLSGRLKTSRIIEKSFLRKRKPLRARAT